MNKVDRKVMDHVPVSLIVYVVSRSNQYKEDDGRSDVRAALLLFTDVI